MTAPPTKDALLDTLADLRYSGLEHILKRCPPGNADGLPAQITARPTGKSRKSV